jgi:hypothetical protein
LNAGRGLLCSMVKVGGIMLKSFISESRSRLCL